MSSTTIEDPRLLTAADVSTLLKDVPISTIHSWARRGFLPSVKLGKHRRFRREQILDFIDQQSRQSRR